MVKEKRWHGKLLTARWLKNWDTVPTHTIAGVLEPYEQLTQSKVYHTCKTHINHPNDTLCRFCGKTAESIPRELASCSGLEQNKYLARCNTAHKVLIWEMLWELQALIQCHVVFSGCSQTHLRVTRDSTLDAESHHLAHPEHYPHTERWCLEISKRVNRDIFCEVYKNSYLSCGGGWKWRMIIAVNFPI